MFKKTKISRSLLLAFGGSLALSALPTLAQQAAQLDRVEITGSSIKRLASEQALPVTTIKAEDLAKVGVTNAEQALQFVVSNQTSSVTSNSVGASNGGASYADLRGLGPNRTLVLVNGKRVVNNPYSAAAVDLNALPFGAVERIEVLTDGASAVYGSDAIAGVVNFITRKEYTGVNLEASGNWPTQSGGGQSYTAGITGGIGSLADQGWNIFGGVSWNKQDALAATDRSFASTAYRPNEGINKTSGTTFPANYVASDGNTYNPSLPTCNPPTSIPSGGICRFDYVPFINIVPQQEQVSLIAKGSYAINKDNTISLEYLQANNTVNTIVSPTPATGLKVNPINPYYPGNGVTPLPPGATFDTTQPVTAGWRQTSLGGRADKWQNDTNRTLLSWEGQYKEWDYSVNYLYSSADVTHDFTGGYVNKAMIQSGLNGTTGTADLFLNPFGDQTAAGQAYLSSTQIIGQVQKANGTLSDFTASASGSVAKLPAGPMMLAVGMEYFKDKANYTNDFTLIRQAVSSGLEGTEDASGSRSAWAANFELSIPIVKDLDLTLAGRYDDYSDFGSTWNPKIALRWQPMQQVLLRGSYNTGFRAPSLYEAYSPNSITNTAQPFNDPVLCPGGTVNPAAGGVASRDCNMQFETKIGGNQNLNPETSKAWNLGIAVQPMDAVTFGVDYFNYNVQNVISAGLSPATIMADPVKYANDIVRCSQVSASEAATLSGCQVPGGDPIAYIVGTNLNLGAYKTSGLDIKGNWQGKATDWGRFSFGYNGTYLFSYDYQLEPGGVWASNLGVFSADTLSAIARYRQVLNFGWQYGAWATNLLNRYTSHYQDLYPAPDGSTRYVAGNNTWDLAVTWSGVKGLAVTGGLTNMFNKQPPFTNQDTGFQVGYDQKYANPIGRTFLLRGTYQF